MKPIYVLHENDEWVTPLREALVSRDLPFNEWFLDTGVVDLSAAPQEGVFYNQMSASSHTRGYPEYTAAVLSWLERSGRRVLIGGRALALEVGKVAHYSALAAEGIRTPRTIAVVGLDEIVEAARSLPPPFITKDNRAGKGLGVRLFHEVDALARYVESEGFELCLADACRIAETDDEFCPTGDAADSLFRILDGFAHPAVDRYEAVLAANDIHIVGVEFIVDRPGEPFTYEINSHTNYNGEAEARAGCSGMGAIAEYLWCELAAVSPDTNRE